jgi:hypothetical protein
MVNFMNKPDFLSYSRHPFHLTNEQLDHLRSLIRKYPYFQAARAVMLLHEKQFEPAAYKESLHRTAAYTTDRGHLYEILHEYFFDAPSGKEPSGEKELTEEKTNQTEAEISGPGTQTGDKTMLSGQKLTYIEWVKRLAEKNQKSSGRPDSKTKKKLLIERFLQNQPKIKPDKNYKPTLLPEAMESIREKPVLMTETLAELYVKQGKYEKAVKAFEILKLKYPEKNRYFATRILEIKSLIGTKKT